MFKLVKYELRANFLTIIGICITVIIASLLLMTKKGAWPMAVPALSVCFTIGSMIVIFIASLKIMSQYLYGDSGYLLFTLPQSGASIMASRLLAALIQISVVGIVTILMFYLTITSKIDFSFIKDIKASQVIEYTFSYIWMIISSLTIIYFCMVIGKVALKGKKIGKVGSFVIFILISTLISWLSFKLISVLPQTLDLSNFTITNGSVLNLGATTPSTAFTVNIAQTIFDIIIFIGLFMSSSYLIDKKLDLS